MSLASTVKENLVRKPAFLRDLHTVLKGVWSPPISTRPPWYVVRTLNPFSFSEETCSRPVMGRCDDDDSKTCETLFCLFIRLQACTVEHRHM
ncbi:jg16753 [Pararge aegeria aegeria]|uniref:Jg16753 protein n=1 Tax=Pararge aegeria aegeria TaxID=348720 RepID=A0A8S4R8E2_9NEOP|nr:jg16753 [Pararge aegeria aegeria]